MITGQARRISLAVAVACVTWNLTTTTSAANIMSESDEGTPPPRINNVELGCSFLHFYAL